jgi:hypothetical protein
MFTQFLGTAATVYGVLAVLKTLPAPMQQRKGISACPTQMHPA